MGREGIFLFPALYENFCSGTLFLQNVYTKVLPLLKWIKDMHALHGVDSEERGLQIGVDLGNQNSSKQALHWSPFNVQWALPTLSIDVQRYCGHTTDGTSWALERPDSTVPY